MLTSVLMELLNVQLLEAFDAETESLAVKQAAVLIKDKQIEQSDESLALLERQMSEIQAAIQDCFGKFFMSHLK